MSKQKNMFVNENIIQYDIIIQECSKQSLTYVNS